MQKELKKVDWGNVLFFDIETARGQKDLKKTDAIYSMVSWKFRDKVTSKELPFKDVRERYLREGGLHPALNKIVCISVVYIHDNTLRLKNIIGEEAEIIKEFYTIANGRMVAGHNIKQFDIPVTRMRAFTNYVNVPDSLNDAGLKKWDIGLDSRAKIKCIDSMESIQGTYYYGISLEEACHLAHIPTPKTDIHGSQVSEAYYKGEIGRIAEYCGRDVVATANSILRMAKKEPLQLDESYIPPLPLSIPELIYAEKGITEENKDALRNLIGKKKLTKKDKVNLETMLLALIVHTPFMQKGDSPELIEAKGIEVKEFINTL